MSKPVIHILPVSFTDNANNTTLTSLETLYAVETAAFHCGRSAEDTTFHQLMFGPPSVVSQNQRTDELEMKLKNESTFKLYKAVLVDETPSNQTEDEKIVGFAIWNFYKPGNRSIREGNNEQISPHRPRIFNDFFDALARNRESFMEGVKLARMSHPDFTLEFSLVRGADSRFVQLDLEFLAILPSYQRLGIGRDLLGVGLEEADRRGIPAWVESTSEAYAFYRSCGFSEVGKVTMDLRKYGADGIVPTYCMLRPKSMRRDWNLQEQANREL
ncbi:hypothetical protein N8T08_004942 [Aspergillus melleus]|uniref:Uncharacterized protein n=1 Tax=Aspergillus melleus TaxID=138277 RepID=A0ACC3B2N5_9EURO|nr:hypothetical protein N8T08_004942 [Aspergillus melleus]